MAVSQLCCCVQAVQEVEVTLRKSGSKLEHLGLKAELFGEIEVLGEETPHRFMHVDKQLCAAGELYRNASYDIAFEKQTTTSADGANGNGGVASRLHETYHGSKVQLRYYVRATLQLRSGDVIVQQEVSIHVPSSMLEVTRNIKTEIGIGEELHLELECNKWKYHLQDVVYGSINFLSIGTEITGVLVQLLRRETLIKQGQSPTIPDADVIATHELLDGCPQTGIIKPKVLWTPAEAFHLLGLQAGMTMHRPTGDRLPIRLFLSNYELTPTMRNVEDLFSVKYYLNLVIVDVDDNAYFKQQEIKLYRRSSGSERTARVSGVTSVTATGHGVKAPTTNCTTENKKSKKIPAPIQLKCGTVMMTLKNDTQLKLDY